MIKLSGFSKKYGDFQAVFPIDLHIPRGETFALLGPNGSGKSTIIKSLVGLARPTTGNILVDGGDLWSNPEEVKAKISYLPQRLTIPDNLTVEEVLNFFLRMKGESRNRLDEILDVIAIKADMKQQVGKLSGGMLQRLGLVISFIGDTQVIVMDEPTLNLDLAGMRHFRAYLKLLKSRGKTILFSSHTLLDAEGLSDRVGVLVNGRLALDQSVSEFKERVKNQSRMVLILADKKPDLVEIALKNGASRAEFENGFFRYHADQSRQIRVLEAIQESGAEILSIATEKPGLDQLVEDHYE